jgi:hypothetical protein
MALAVRKDSPYKSVKDLVAAAKANPSKVSIGGVALWSITHILHLRLEKDAVVKMQFVPHSGSASQVTNLLGGHVDAITAYSDEWPLRDHHAIRLRHQGAVPGFESATFKELGFDRYGRVSRGTHGRAWIMPKKPRRRSDVTNSPEAADRCATACLQGHGSEESATRSRGRSRSERGPGRGPHEEVSRCQRINGQVIS